MMWQYSRRDTKVLVLATLLVFSGFGLMAGNNWRSLAPGTDPYLLSANSVGVLAGVSANRMNTLAEQLAERERELTAREAALAHTGQANAQTLMVVTVAGAGLLGLILTNFYLDNRRRHSLA